MFRRRKSKDLITGLECGGWFTSSNRFCLVLPRKHNVGRRWYRLVLSQSYIPPPSPSWFPRTEGNNAVASSSRSTPNNDATNFSVTAGFIFPNDHSQQQHQQLALGLLQTQSQSLFCVIRIAKWKCGKWGRREWLPETTIADVYFSRYPQWINDFEEQVFISIRWGDLFQTRLGTIDNRAEDTLSQPKPYTGNINGNNDHASGFGTIANSHIPLAARQ